MIWILFLVGFLLPSWFHAGTINQMVTIALNIITPDYFFTLSFIIALFFSMILGTSVGTLSSIGIPIMGTAIALHLPSDIVAGALVSGAFVGDRTSPFSSAHQLLAHTVEITVKKQWKAMSLTTVLAIVLGIIFYRFLDIHFLHNFSITIYSSEKMELSFIKFLPPIVLIVMVLFRYKILYAFIFSITIACFLSFLDGIKIGELLTSLWEGIDGLGGGLANMYLLLLFLALAGAYNGLLEELKVIQTLLDRWLQASHSLLNDTIKTMIATLGITLVAANQTLPIILTGRSFLAHWSAKYSNEELARVMGDSTMLFPGIVPWSVLTIMCSTIMGVSIFEYFSYAVFLWILPILTIGVSIVKTGKRKRNLLESH
ncbi:Na+/H+ antiporter NhaC family protein [Neobacillus sp. D3-1R]|uniref:Na+/H+ antiporter NhaC family protein n=1 Tax=Neobacillus sp. D3-1R TaxID=3445778 RepID=UPI003FA13A70